MTRAKVAGLESQKPTQAKTRLEWATNLLLQVQKEK
jgi:hypothetical protein